MNLRLKAYRLPLVLLTMGITLLLIGLCLLGAAILPGGGLKELRDFATTTLRAGCLALTWGAFSCVRIAVRELYHGGA